MFGLGRPQHSPWWSRNQATAASHSPPTEPADTGNDRLTAITWCYGCGNRGHVGISPHRSAWRSRPPQRGEQVEHEEVRFTTWSQVRICHGEARMERHCQEAQSEHETVLPGPWRFGTPRRAMVHFHNRRATVALSMTRPAYRVSEFVQDQ